MREEEIKNFDFEAFNQKMINIQEKQMTVIQQERDQKQGSTKPKKKRLFSEMESSGSIPFAHII